MTHRCSWRGVILAVGSLLVIQAAAAEPPVTLAERTPRVGQVVLNTLTAVQQGRLVLPAEGDKDKKVTIRAEARLIFEQYPIQAGQREARYLKDAVVGVLVEGRKTLRTMRRSVRLIATSVRDKQLFFYSPRGPLTYEELQTLHYPFDPLVLSRLVDAAKGGVVVGKQWRLSDELVGLLVRFDAVERQDIRVVCDSVTEGLVRLRVAGTAVGTFAIAPARVTLDASLEFDRKEQLFKRVEAELAVVKSPGPVEPGFEGTVRVTLQRQWAEAEMLTAELIRSLPAGAAPGLDYLVFEHPEGKFRVYYPRRWRIHFADRKSLVLKWVDDRGLVAQCNLVLGHKASPGTHLKPEEIREQVIKAVAKHKAQLLEERELPGQEALWIYRMALAGVVGKEAVVWHYYTLADRSGQHLLVVFSVPASRSSQFGGSDLEIVQSIQMPARKEPGAGGGGARVSRRER